MSRLQTPYISESALYLAHLCAQELWQGYGYDTGSQLKSTIETSSRNTGRTTIKEVVLSDEYLLRRFSAMLYSKIMPLYIKNTFPINDSMFEAFRRVAGIKQTERRGSKPDYEEGLKFLRGHIASIYRSYKNFDNPVAKNNCIVGLLHATSVAFTVQGKLQSPPKSEQVLLANRMLYFMMPNCLVFNYSNKIAQGLGIKAGTPQHYASYQEALYKCMEQNWTSLCRFDMPPPRQLDIKIYAMAKKSGWWQRRILDLALKNHFTKAGEFKISDRVKDSFHTLPNLYT